MNFNLMVITSLIGLDSNEYDVDSVILEDEFSYQINAKLKETTERKCPHCGSKKVVIKDYKKQFVKHQVIKNCDKKVIVCLTKQRYKCKDCGSTYMPKNNFVRPGCNVSNKMCWEIADRTKDLVSFKTIADDLKLSENTVISVFDQMVKIGRKPLTTAICIDEKHFHSNYGKYVCVISNPVTSEILNLIPSRTKSYLIEFFKSLSKDEKNSVKYVISDMFEPYRTIIKRYLPNAIHIIDHFHVTRLFTSAIQIARIRYMKSLRQDTFAYKYIKKNGKFLL